MEIYSPDHAVDREKSKEVNAKNNNCKTGFKK